MARVRCPAGYPPCITSSQSTSRPHDAARRTWSPHHWGSRVEHSAYRPARSVGARRIPGVLPAPLHRWLSIFSYNPPYSTTAYSTHAITDRPGALSTAHRARLHSSKFRAGLRVPSLTCSAARSACSYESPSGTRLAASQSPPHPACAKPRTRVSAIICERRSDRHSVMGSWGGNRSREQAGATPRSASAGQTAP